jgi:hypothetical protein
VLGPSGGWTGAWWEPRMCPAATPKLRRVLIRKHTTAYCRRRTRDGRQPTGRQGQGMPGWTRDGIAAVTRPQEYVCQGTVQYVPSQVWQTCCGQVPVSVPNVSEGTSSCLLTDRLVAASCTGGSNHFGFFWSTQVCADIQTRRRRSRRKVL